MWETSVSFESKECRLSLKMNMMSQYFSSAFTFV